MRGFAAGILIASAVFAFFYYLIFNDGQQTAKTAVRQKPLTEATVTQYLTNHHLKAIDIGVYNQWQAQNKPAEKGGQKNPPANKGKAQANNQSSDKPVNYTLQINNGMMPNDISSALVSAKILKSNQQSAFDNYLHQNHLEKYVQLGKFNVNSKMSIQQLVQVITKNHKN